MKEILLALVLAHGADAASTCAAIHAGAREANPLRPSGCALNIVASAGLATVQVLALQRLEHKQPALTRTLGLVGVGLESGVTGWNLHVGLVMRRR